MRPIGLVAAAAAGVIAPLAIAMPALASTQSSVLSGVTSFVDGDNGPDNGDNGDDNKDDGYNNDDNKDDDDNNDDNKDDDHNGDNGDHNGDNGDNGDHNGDNGDHNGDNGDHNGDNGDHNGDNGDHYDGPHLSAYSSGSEASGDVSFIVDVDDASEFDTYVLESSALDAACDSNTISGATAEADRFGHLNVSGDAFNCLPGTYKIAVSQTGDHEETFYVDVHVD